MHSVFEATRELKNIQEEYIKKKDEYDREMDALTRREDELRNKDLKFQESLIKFNRFLQENENKRHTAIQRQSQDESEISAHRLEIENLKDLVQQKNKEEEKLRTLVNSHLKYKHFLKKVVDLSQASSGEFSEIQHIIDRYHLLNSTNCELHTKIQNNTKEHEAMRFKYAQFMKYSGNDILAMNNQIARLQRELEQLSLNANRSLEIFHGTSRKANTFLAELTRAMCVIDHMKERLIGGDRNKAFETSTHEKDTVTKIIHSKISQATGDIQIIADHLIAYQEIVKEYISKNCI